MVIYSVVIHHILMTKQKLCNIRYSKTQQYVMDCDASSEVHLRFIGGFYIWFTRFTIKPININKSYPHSTMIRIVLHEMKMLSSIFWSAWIYHAQC